MPRSSAKTRIIASGFLLTGRSPSPSSSEYECSYRGNRTIGSIPGEPARRHEIMPRRLRMLLQLAYIFAIFSYGLTMDRAAGQEVGEIKPPLSKWRYLREEISTGKNYAAELQKAAALLAAFQTSGKGELMFTEYDVLNGSRELSTEELAAIAKLPRTESDARWEQCKALGDRLEQRLAVIRDDCLRDTVRHVRHSYGGWHNAVRLRLSEDVIGRLKAQFSSASHSLNTYIEEMEKLVGSDSKFGEKEIWTRRQQLLPGEWKEYCTVRGKKRRSQQSSASNTVPA